MTTETRRKDDAETKASTALIGCLGLFGVLGFLAVIHGIFITGHELVEARMGDPGGLSVATWNVAAINNNPFEYWITHDDAAYHELMDAVQGFIDDPGDRDVPVHRVFTPEMFAELSAAMRAAGWAGVDDVARIYRDDFAKRSIVAGFLKDGTLGKKRLASMPDRVTNTIRAYGPDGAPRTAYRPTVINCYAGALDDGAAWWAAWRRFVFQTKVSLARGAAATPVYGLLNPIKRSKYPALTEDEERLSLPLQTLAGAIFDAILVHAMNALGRKTWQPLRRDMCDRLNRRKDARTVEILAGAYRGADVLFLQETATAFRANAAATDLGADYHVLSPASADPSRDQNSLVLLKKARIPDAGRVAELSDAVAARLPGDAPTAAGDLAVFSAVDAFDRAFVFASFHGDTNGLATKPVTTALLDHVENAGLRDHVLVFGLDANTYKVARDGYQGVLDYQRAVVARGLASQRGATDAVDPEGYTTFNARTYLQPQLNKAVAFKDRYTNVNVDHNPKDFVLWYADQAALVETGKDNTGDRHYVEDMMFPTLDFPSDHGLTFVKLKLLDGDS